MPCIGIADSSIYKIFGYDIETTKHIFSHDAIKVKNQGASHGTRIKFKDQGPDLDTTSFYVARKRSLCVPT